jgi:GTPase
MGPEKVITAGLKLPAQSLTQFQSSMEELRRLVETAGGVVLKEFFQAREKPDAATLMGKGKIAELGEEILKCGAKTIIFDDNLTVAQQKNIEKIVKAKVVDRTRLILDIFAQRARTKEGQLQIELAQLHYVVPRLTGAWRGYSQQSGGIGTRGPGERKIEVERRYIRDRIKKLKMEIEDISQHRQHARSNRQSVPLPQVALVGYTNVGKSTLLNKLVGENVVYADDKLFATLDPTTRRVKLPGGRTILFSDTVGFIQKLPHYLVAAFHATLEEVSHANVLVHLVDATSDTYNQQSTTVLDVIKSLKADHIPILTVFNKADLLTSAQRTAIQRQGGFLLSGKTGTGVSELLEAIERKLDEGLIDVDFHLPFSKQHLMTDIHKTAHIISQTSNEHGTQVRMKIDAGNWKKLTSELGKK